MFFRNVIIIIILKYIYPFRFCHLNIAMRRIDIFFICQVTLWLEVTQWNAEKWMYEVRTPTPTQSM